MAAETVQTYANHRRFDLWHIIPSLLLLLNVVGAIVHACKHRESPMAWLGILTALALVVVAFLLRFYCTRLQDRIIRMEMRLRLAQVLPAESRGVISQLTLGQLVGLRFASDAELPGLVARVVGGELAKQDAIKRAITAWQADHLRV